MRRPTPRLPFVVLLTGALSAAVVSSESNASPGARADIHGGLAPLDALMPLAPGRDAVGSTHYCAAGTGEPGGMADHTVVVVNPGGAPVTALVTPYGGDLVDGGRAGAPGTPDRVRELTVGPGERAAVRLGDLVDAPFVAAVVEVDGGPAVVEHEVAGPLGRDSGPCATRAGSAWHLAWGATTRDAREVVVVFNPFPSRASVDVVFRTDGGGREPVAFQGVPVPGAGVVALDVGTEVRREPDVAATVRARRGRVVVERLQSFDGSDGPAGLSVALASPEPATAWAFAGGEVVPAGAPVIAVYNPGEDRAEVDVAVLPDAGGDGVSRAGDGATTGDGPLRGAATAAGGPEGGDDPVPSGASGARAPQPFGLSIGPGDHRLVRLGDEARVPSGVGLAVLVTARNGVPVVVERVVRTAVVDARDGDVGEGGSDVGDGGGDDGGAGADVGDGEAGRAGRSVGAADARITGPTPEGGLAAGPGSPVASRTWWFGGLIAGDTSPPAVAVLNPTSRWARVTLRAAPGDATVGATAVSVPPGGRRTIRPVADTLDPDAVLVVDSGTPVVAERLVVSRGVVQALSPGVPEGDGAVRVDMPET